MFQHSPYNIQQHFADSNLSSAGLETPHENIKYRSKSSSLAILSVGAVLAASSSNRLTQFAKSHHFDFSIRWKRFKSIWVSEEWLLVSQWPNSAGVVYMKYMWIVHPRRGLEVFVPCDFHGGRHNHFKGQYHSNQTPESHGDAHRDPGTEINEVKLHLKSQSGYRLLTFVSVGRNINCLSIDLS